MSDDFAVGRQVLSIRLVRGLRQADVAARAGISTQTVSKLEHGLLEGMTVRCLRSISRALEMPPLVTMGWRMPEVAQLRDRLHAAMVEAVAALLNELGWLTRVEYSFNCYGERGSVDILGWHPALSVLLIVEVKTRLWDIQDTLIRLDLKRRLVPKLAVRDGWEAAQVAVLLVLPDISTHRHVIKRHQTIFGRSLPDRSVRVRDWLENPRGGLRGIWFLPISPEMKIARSAWLLRARRVPRKAGKRPGQGSISSPRPVQATEPPPRQAHRPPNLHLR